MNAIAHAVEGLYAVDGNPIVSLMAEEGIRALAQPCRGVRQAMTRRSMVHGFAARCWAVLPWRCITSFAMCWVARLICPMPRPTR